MKIIVISLAEATTRRAAIARQLDDSGLDYHVLDAVDGRNGHEGLFDACDEQRFLVETGRRITPAEIGRYASHVAVWRICCASAQPVVVLEDDACLREDFAEAVDVCDKLIDGCGFIRLQTERRSRKRLVLRTDNGFSLYRYTSVPCSAAGYVIGPRVAAAFCRRSAVLTAPVDIFLKNVQKHEQTLYGLMPYQVDASGSGCNTTAAGRITVRKTLMVRLRRVLSKAGDFVRRPGIFRRRPSLR